MSLVLDGVVVEHTQRPLERLYERSVLLFAGFVFLTLVVWIIIATILEFPAWIVALGSPLVIITTALTPIWLEVRAYSITGNRRVIIDERGLQIEGTLLPWSELNFHRHGGRESSVSFWELGSETIIVTFERENKRFSAFLGVRYRPKAPIAITETLSKTLSERETLILESYISEHRKGPTAQAPR